MPKTLIFPKCADPAGDRASGRHDEFESVALVGGFSLSGLSLSCLLSKLLMEGEFSTSVLLLVLCVVPVAIALGFALAGAER
jgi:hypothetical protein